MELRILLVFLRRWAWLLILGLALGAGIGYWNSQRQPPVYSTSTKVLVIQARENNVTAELGLNDWELIQTYISLLTTRPVLEATSERLGFAVSGGQISAAHTPGTRMMAVTVRSGDPVRAALVANTLVDVLIESNKTLQSGRFASSEESLQAQITQLEAQIATLRDDLNGNTVEDGQDRRLMLESEMTALRTNIIGLVAEIESLTSPALTPEERADLLTRQVEVAQLKYTLTIEQNAYNGRLQRDPDARDPTTERRILDLQEQTIVLDESIEASRTAALSSDPETQNLVAAKQAQLSQLQLDLSVAEEQYLNLVASNQSTTGVASAAQERGQNELSLYQQLYSSLLSTYESVRLARLQNTPDLVQVERAIASGSPIQPRPVQAGILAGAIGLLLAGGIAFVIEYLDDTIKSPEVLSRTFGLPVLGFIAESQAQDGNREGLAVADEPRSPQAEAFRALRTNLEFAGIDSSLHTLLVTSPNATDGKTTVATNLAISLAQSGRRVVLIDADLRRPRVHHTFDLPNRQGISDFFRRSELCLDEVAVKWEEMDKLQIVTSGSLPPNPTELLGSARMDAILEQTKDHADIVIIDSPPFVVSDATVLAAKVDGVLLVLQPGRTSIGAVRAMIEQYQRANANIVGVVLNRISQQQGRYKGGYRYYNAPYYGKEYYLYRAAVNGNGSSPEIKRNDRIRQAFSRLRN